MLKINLMGLDWNANEKKGKRGGRLHLLPNIGMYKLGENNNHEEWFRSRPRTRARGKWQNP